MTQRQSNFFKNLFFVRIFRKHIGDKNFLKRVAIIALPVYLTSIITLLVNIIDSTMIAPLGADKLAAVNAAGEIGFFAISSIMGFLQMGFVYFAQFHGENKYSYNTKSSLTVMVYTCLLWTGIVVVFVNFFSEQLINIFLDDKETIKLSAEYLRIVSYSWFFQALIIPITWALGRIGQPIKAVAITITSIILNATLNYLFINGIEVPKLGVKGVAVSTLLSRVAELGVAATILIIFRIQEFNGFLNPIYWSFRILKKISSKWIMFINEILWVTSLIFQFGIVSTRGDDAAAVVGSAHVLSQILFATHAAFGATISFFIGRSLGANQIEDAKDKATRLFKLLIIVSFVYSMLFASISPAIARSFDVTTTILLTKAEFTENLTYIMLLLCLMFTSFSCELFFVHCLWLGGRQIQAFIGDVITNWIINSVCLIAAFYTNVDYITLYVLLVISDGFKCFVLFFFYERFEWLRNLTGKEIRHPYFLKIINLLKKRKLN